MALEDYIREKPVIGTARLRLRALAAGDIPALREWMPDESLYAYWGKGPGKTDKHPELLFAKAERPVKSFHLGIEERASGKAVGELWVHRIENDRMATVAIRLAPACQGKGYGTEALAAMTRFCFARTQLRRLQAEVDVRNAASRRMLEKCGYKREGLIRQGKMVNTWCDYFIYGILASDTAGEGDSAG
jgi:ribosomal-protein-alanine N-acetyltransferase